MGIGNVPSVYMTTRPYWRVMFVWCPCAQWPSSVSNGETWHCALCHMSLYPAAVVCIKRRGVTVCALPYYGLVSSGYRLNQTERCDSMYSAICPCIQRLSSVSNGEIWQSLLCHMLSGPGAIARIQHWDADVTTVPVVGSGGVRSVWHASRFHFSSHAEARSRSTSRMCYTVINAEIAYDYYFLFIILPSGGWFLYIFTFHGIITAALP